MCLNLNEIPDYETARNLILNYTKHKNLLIPNQLGTRREDRRADDPMDVSGLSRKGKSKGQLYGPPTSSLYCNFCHRTGHTWDYCRLRKGKGKSKGDFKGGNRLSSPKAGAKAKARARKAKAEKERE